MAAYCLFLLSCICMGYGVPTSDVSAIGISIFLFFVAVSVRELLGE